MRAALRAAAVALVIVAGLSACSTAVGSPDSASRSPSASPSPAATRAADDPVVKLLVGSTTMTAFTADGDVVSTLSYTESADRLVGDLTAIFGRTPLASRADAGMEAPPATRSAWGGFALTVPDETSAPYATPWVLVDSDRVGSVAIETSGGVSVGDPISRATSQTGATSEHYTPAGEDAYTAVYLDARPPTSGADDPGLDWRVFLVVPDSTGTVQNFRAPSPNRGV